MFHLGYFSFSLIFQIGLWFFFLILPFSGLNTKVNTEASFCSSVFVQDDDGPFTEADKACNHTARLWNILEVVLFTTDST